MTEQTPAHQPASPRQRSLRSAILELEEHVAQRGWDAPARVFALVRTAAALEQDPALAELLDDAALAQARRDPQSLTMVEQENLPMAADLEDLLGRLAWPQTVDGVALAVERLVLPPAAQEEAEAITDAAERLAFLQERPDREDIRMVVGVLRSGESWCALRSRTHDDDASIYQGEQLVPGLTEALAATFL